MHLRQYVGSISRWHGRYDPVLLLCMDFSQIFLQRCLLTHTHTHTYVFSRCDKCKAPKPPRSHHCSTCKTCVLQMDHHCPFTANCVGKDNYRHFFLFVVWYGMVFRDTLMFSVHRRIRGLLLFTPSTSPTIPTASASLTSL